MAAPTRRTDSEIIVFNSRFCGRKNVEKNETPDKSSDASNNNTSIPNVHSGKNTIFDIKKARYEIIRYGLTGFDKEQQTNTKVAMAIKLGAKPPKRKCINYKTLMEQKKKEKEVVKNTRGTQYNLQPLKQRKKSSKKKKLKNQPNSLV